jgi:hypothetical protein
VEHLQAQIEVEKARARDDLAEPVKKEVKLAPGKGKKLENGPHEPTSEKLKKAIIKTYKQVGGEPDSSIDPISMLTFVEKTLEAATIKLVSTLT